LSAVQRECSFRVLSWVVTIRRPNSFESTFRVPQRNRAARVLFSHESSRFEFLDRMCFFRVLSWVVALRPNSSESAFRVPQRNRARVFFSQESSRFQFPDRILSSFLTREKVPCPSSPSRVAQHRITSHRSHPRMLMSVRVL
jgi:hypothetical protein